LDDLDDESASVIKRRVSELENGNLKIDNFQSPLKSFFSINEDKNYS